MALKASRKPIKLRALAWVDALPGSFNPGSNNDATFDNGATIHPIRICH
jgi:hypothetical protein